MRDVHGNRLSSAAIRQLIRVNDVVHQLDVLLDAGCDMPTAYRILRPDILAHRENPSEAAGSTAS